MKKQISTMLAAILMMHLIIVPTVATEDNMVGKIEDRYNETVSYVQLQMQETYEEEKEAIEMYDYLMGEIAVQELSMNQEDSDIVYPENYGGAYLGDNGKLVVCVVDGMGEDVPEKISSYEKNNEYTLELVDYSLNELKAAHGQLLDYLFEYEDMYEIDSVEYELFSSIVGMGTDQMNNTVYVQMLNVTDEKEQSFNAIFGESSDIYCISEVGGTEPTATLRPGGKLLLAASGSRYGSIGFRASFTDDDANTFHGFVTAGHCLDTGDNAYVTVGTGRENVGKAIVSMMSGSTDGCFVGITNSSYSMGNVAAYSNDTGSSVDAPVISSTYYSGSNSLLSNSTIYKVGATTFFTAGSYLTDDHVSTYGGTVRLTNMLTHTALTQPGDSGGCVFTYRSNQNIIIGVTSGTVYKKDGEADDPNDFLKGVCSQARYMITSLGITIN